MKYFQSVIKNEWFEAVSFNLLSMHVLKVGKTIDFSCDEIAISEITLVMGGNSFMN